MLTKWGKVPINVFEFIGVEFDFVFHDGIESRGCKFIHFDKPLHR